MTKFAITVLPEVQKILEDNAIDWTRCTDATIHHSVKGRVTEITVTLLAVKPEVVA